MTPSLGFARVLIISRRSGIDVPTRYGTRSSAGSFRVNVCGGLVRNVESLASFELMLGYFLTLGAISEVWHGIVHIKRVN